MPELHLVVDWDGTVTERDTFHVAIERFGDVDVFRAMEEEIGRRLTLHEVIAVEMATISAPLDEVVALLVDTVASGRVPRSSSDVTTRSSSRWGSTS